jgi:transducin (beta)-like 1
MTMDSAVVALAFTPDGEHIAGATSKQILIWIVNDASLPRARWVRGSQPGWQSPKGTEGPEDEDQHCLCWDSEGQQLAYAVNSQASTFRAHELS